MTVFIHTVESTHGVTCGTNCTAYSPWFSGYARTTKLLKISQRHRLEKHAIDWFPSDTNQFVINLSLAIFQLKWWAKYQKTFTAFPNNIHDMKRNEHALEFIAFALCRSINGIEHATVVTRQRIILRTRTILLFTAAHWCIFRIYMLPIEMSR